MSDFKTISINRKNQKIRYFLFFGFWIFFSTLIFLSIFLEDSISEHTIMRLTYISLSLFLGWAIIFYFFERYSVIGRMSIVDRNIFISENNNNIEFSVDNILEINVFKNKFEGYQKNYPHRAGSLRSSDGINKIEIIDKYSIYSCLFIIENEYQMNAFESSIENLPDTITIYTEEYKGIYI